MTDVVTLVKRLGITDRRVVDKASEYVRLSTSRLGVGGLGQVRGVGPRRVAAGAGCRRLAWWWAVKVCSPPGARCCWQATCLSDCKPHAVL